MLVGNQAELVYESAAAVVGQIDAALSDPESARELQASLPTMAELGHDRFQRDIAVHVEELLSVSADV